MNKLAREKKEKIQLYDPERVDIQYTEVPDWDWCIDQLVMLADEINKLKKLTKPKRSM